MTEKYFCPKCGKELDEKYVIVCTCPYCHGIFDKPAIQQVSAPEDREKKDPGKGEADKKTTEEREELPSKTINRVELLALFSLLIISLVAYFVINKTVKDRKATQEKSQFAILPPQKAAENIKQEETPQAGGLKEPEGGLLILTPPQQKEEEAKRPAAILQTEKFPEAEEKVTKAEKLQPEAGETPEETRLAAQKEAERQFQYYYDKGEAALRQSGGAASALGFYRTALSYKPGDRKTQGKINFILAILKAAQEAKKGNPEPKITGNEVPSFPPARVVEKINTKEAVAKDKSQMVLIPAGKFRMGSPPGEGAKDEHPPHKVFLDAYYIDKYEVTVAQYRKFCEATGRNMRKKQIGERDWRDNEPISDVSWNDAAAYAQYYGKRLPTEAEWEKAARAGSITKYCFGDAEANLKDYAWYSANSSNQTHPVGTKKPNAFGIYDMYGNAWEWCSDWYADDYYENSPANNPKGPNTVANRSYVMRGGGWDSAAGDCCSANRDWENPAGKFGGCGFRCASSL